MPSNGRNRSDGHLHRQGSDLRIDHEAVLQDAIYFLARSEGLECDSSSILVVVKAAMVRHSILTRILHQIDDMIFSLDGLLGDVEEERTFDIDALNDYLVFVEWFVGRAKARLDDYTAIKDHWKELKNFTRSLKKAVDTFATSMDDRLGKCVEELARLQLRNAADLSPLEKIPKLMALSKAKKRQQRPHVEAALTDCKRFVVQARDTQLAPLKGKITHSRAKLNGLVRDLDKKCTALLGTDALTILKDAFPQEER